MAPNVRRKPVKCRTFGGSRRGVPSVRRRAAMRRTFGGVSEGGGVWGGGQGTAGAEEGAEEVAALGGEDAGGDGETVVEARVGGDVGEAADGAGLGVGGAEDEAAEARVHEGAGAHETGLERDVEGRGLQVPVAERARGLPKRQQLGVRGRVAVGL